MEKIDFETVLVEASRLPYVKIDRELFLRKELRGKYSKEIVDLAIEYNPAYAGIKAEDLDQIAKSCITSETTKVTALSAAAGIPGGFGLIGAIPADLAQYFGHILRALQELIYIYGWKELDLNTNNMSEETKNILTLFVGIMFGVNGAATAVNKMAGQMAKQVAKKLPQKALTKGVVYPVVKKVATMLGVHMTKDIFAKGVSKAIPVLGAAISGGLTYVTYKPMAEKLKRYLETCEIANVDFYKEMQNEDIIDVKVTEA
nr:EcsC family protein [uncultured Blautia sp.]